jgi:predicted XRE-type DNA-binding protein
MPRVAIKRNEYKIKDNKAYLKERIKGRMKTMDITQGDIANELHVSQGSVSLKINNSNFTYTELMTVCRMLEFDDEDILKFMKA